MINQKKLILSLSPMAGITDLPFRLICKKLGADVVYSEMISATGLFYGQNQKSLALAQSVPKENPLAIQLFGNNPKHFAKATKIISKLGKNIPCETKVNSLSSIQGGFEQRERRTELVRRASSGKSNKEVDQVINFRSPEEININFGCPAPKIYKQESGCFLMKKPILAKKIIQAVLDNTNLPVSIKIRSGISTTEALKFLTKIKDLNWTKVIVHGRTYEEGFSGKIDFNKIKKIKELFPGKKVVANGGIFSPENALEVLEKTGVSEIAIARGCLGNPWLFQQTKNYLKTGSYRKPSLEEIKKITLKHAQLFEKYNSTKNLVPFRKHLGWYFKDFENAKKLRKKLFSIETLSELKKFLQTN